MATSPFTLSTGSNTVVLNAERKGQAAFTVTNISGRALRGRAVPKPLEPTTVNWAGWLNVEGKPERDFDIATTEQFSVQVAVPPDAPAGAYTFRLDAVGVDNPDENFSQGPVVTFKVMGGSRPFPWWIVAVIVGVIIVIALGAVFVPPLIAPRPTLTPTPSPTPTETPTPTPTPTPVPGNFGGVWLTNFAELNLAQNGATIAGNFRVYGQTALTPIQGTITGNTLAGSFGSGPVSRRSSFRLVLAANGSLSGTWSELLSREQHPWCGVRSGALPAGCGFSGAWRLAGDSQSGGANATLVQTGSALRGDYFNGTVNGTVAGTVSGWEARGNFTTSFGTGSFRWVLVDSNSDQFQGNWNVTNAWCGFRTGSAAPNPCQVPTGPIITPREFLTEVVTETPTPSP